MHHSVYDEIGVGYAGTRREDPRLRTAIWSALDGCATVVNVGAGTGSYEPPHASVLAVEPSWEMIRQRSRSRAPVTRARAEALPFASGRFDAALAILTLHHWSDRSAGLREMRRVARERVILLTWDPATPDWWLTERYFPAFRERDLERFDPLQAIGDALGGIEVIPFPIPHDCADGFQVAWWRRPDAYLDPAVRAGISSFGQADPVAVERGLRLLGSDLASGEWERRYGHLRARDALDLGFRLVIARA